MRPAKAGHTLGRDSVFRMPSVFFLTFNSTGLKDVVVPKIDKEKATTIAGQITDWATSQSFNNILLCAILMAIGWGGWYTVTTAIPAHLRMIQMGYETIIEEHRQERGRTIDAYDKWIDRISSHADAGKPPGQRVTKTDN